jgi:hypothetical protein
MLAFYKIFPKSSISTETLGSGVRYFMSTLGSNAVTNNNQERFAAINAQIESREIAMEYISLFKD